MACPQIKNKKISFIYFFLVGWGVVFGTKKNFFLKIVYIWQKFPLNPFSIPKDDKNKRG
jgi:hypothetical protein